jgi:hypothetical protein
LIDFDQYVGPFIYLVAEGIVKEPRANGASSNDFSRLFKMANGRSGTHARNDV